MMSSKIVNFEKSFLEKHGKSFLMAVNVIYIMIFIFIIGLGIWIAFYDPVGLFATVIIIFGLIRGSLNVFGFWVAFKERITGLKVYAWILLILEILGIIVAITSFGESSTGSSKLDDEDDNQMADLMDKTNVMTYIDTLIQIICIYVAFRYSTVLKKAKMEDAPPDYSKI